jgi:hypothetical protein
MRKDMEFQLEMARKQAIDDDEERQERVRRQLVFLQLKQAEFSALEK